MKKLVLAAALLFPLSALQAQQTLTPELLWQFGRLGSSEVSPDKKTVVYTVTYYDLKENKGNADIYTIPASGGAAIKPTILKQPSLRSNREKLLPETYHSLKKVIR